MDKKNLVSVVIPNWNGVELLKKSLKSLTKQSFTDFEVIIVDNGSTDDSVKFIKNNFPNFQCIRLSKNCGFPSAVNAGIKKSSGRYIVLLNNDTEVHADCIKYLVETANNHPEVGMVAAKILNFYQRDRIDNAGDYIDSVGHLYTRGYGEKDSLMFNKSDYTFLVTGGGSLFKKEIFQKVGFFDESYFAYMEDADLCFRAQLAGFKGWYEPRAVIYHIRMGTSSRNPALRDCLNFRNMTMNIIKDYPSALILHNYNWLKILLVNIHTLIFLASKGLFWGALKVEWDVLINIHKLLQKRKNIQKLKIVSDEYIISNVREKRLKIS